MWNQRGIYEVVLGLAFRRVAVFGTMIGLGIALASPAGYTNCLWILSKSTLTAVEPASGGFARISHRRDHGGRRPPVWGLDLCREQKMGIHQRNVYNAEASRPMGTAVNVL